MDIINDAARANYIINEDYDNARRVDSKLNRGYFSTNEDLRYLKHLSLNNKDILSVCGSGDHAFMCLIDGAKSVDTFDSNPLQYYIMELKRASIMALEKEEYLKYFPIFGGNIEEMYNKKYYIKVRDYLHDEAKLFWDFLYKSENYKFYLLQLYSFSLAVGSDYTKDYDLLKSRLMEDNITFTLQNLMTINEKTFNKKYDVAILSNIYDHIYRYREYNEREYLNLIKNNILPILKDNGICVYHYQLDSIPVKSFEKYDGMYVDGSTIKILKKN